MKITTRQLREIIKEETEAVMAGGVAPPGEVFDWDVLVDQIADALEALPVGDGSALDLGTLAAKLSGPVAEESAAAGGVDVEDAYDRLRGALAQVISAVEDARDAAAGLRMVLP